MASPKSRSTVRTQLAALLRTELTVTNTLVAEVYDHLPVTFDRKSPVVTVWTGGSNPEQFGLGTEQYRTMVRVEVAVWVADEDPEDLSWTRSDVEDRLDEIYQKIMKVIAENRKEPSNYWEYIEFAGPSEIIRATISGMPYWGEFIPIEARVQDGT